MSNDLGTLSIMATLVQRIEELEKRISKLEKLPIPPHKPYTQLPFKLSQQTKALKLVKVINDNNRTCTNSELATYFNVSSKTISRWLDIIRTYVTFILPAPGQLSAVQLKDWVTQDIVDSLDD